MGTTRCFWLEMKLLNALITQSELITLIMSNFSSILYYNSEIWQLASLKATLKQKLLSSSAKALKVWVKLSDNNVSFDTLHKICKRALPIDFMKYKLALFLFRIYNNDFNFVEFSHLNYNQVLTGRQTKFKTIKTNNLRAGLNALSNRFHCLIDLRPLSWLNMSMNAFKVHCKRLLLTNWNHP